MVALRTLGVGISFGFLSYACGHSARDFGTAGAGGSSGSQSGTGGSDNGGSSPGGVPGGFAGADEVAGAAGSDAIGDGTAVGTLNQACANEGDTACSGHVKKQQLICSAGKWAVNGTCSGSNNCDTTPDENAGSCQPIVPECASLQPGDIYCDGASVKQCGPDLVSANVEKMCSGGYCNAPGVCGECAAGSTQCSGTGVQTCSTTGIWSTVEICPSTAPVCTAGACVNPPSCKGLAATCGPNGNDSCCRSAIVEGTTAATMPPFYRSYDGVSPYYKDKGFPAVVSDFSLDTYDITVGRFNKFMSAYAQNMTTQGAGKNPNNPNDSGWDATNWNPILEASQTALGTAVSCNVTYQTWTAGNPNLPMNCINWYEAEAFCIWDGGRLPTEAEWNYAASGGTEQRIYPWGSTAPGANADLAAYGCYYNGTGSGTCTGVSNIALVGTIPAGNGKWGHADLVGGIEQWLQDFGNSPYPTTCNDCANLAATPYRALRGGFFYVATGTDATQWLFSSARSSFKPAAHSYINGARCARTR